MPPVTELSASPLGTEKTTVDRFDPYRKHKLERILKYLEGKCHLTKTFLESFIRPTLELCYLRLIGFYETETSELLKLASMRCPNLLVLKLVGNLNNEVLTYCLPKFRKLQDLTIQHDKMQDSILEEIGAQCGSLRYLNVSFSPISDSGIMCLCYNIADQVVKNMPRTICKSLKIIDLQGTKVTRLGIKIALTYLPVLESLTHDNTVEAIAEMTIYAKEKGHRVQTFSLMDLSILSSYRDKSLSVALDVCPFITKLEITALPRFNNKDLQLISVLSFLVDLKVTGYEIGREVTFDCDSYGNLGIGSLLLHKGKWLESLEISSFHDVNLYFVILFCPHLKKLSLKNNIYSSQPNDQSQSKRQKVSIEILDKLEELCLVECNDKDGCITHDIIVHLFSSSFLKKIIIWNSQELNDEIILNANSLHHFKYLELIEFHECDFLNESAVNVLLELGNPLNTIVLDSCLNFTQLKCERLICKVRKNNLDILIQYEEREVSEDDQEDEVVG